MINLQIEEICKERKRKNSLQVCLPETGIEYVNNKVERLIYQTKRELMCI